MYILNLDCILEIKHIAKCGSSAAFLSDLNKKRNSGSVFFGAEESVFMLWNTSDAKSGSDAVHKQFWKFPTVFSQPVLCLGIAEMSSVCLGLSCWGPLLRVLVEDTWWDGQVQFSDLKLKELTITICLCKGLCYEEHHLYLNVKKPQ